MPTCLVRIAAALAGTSRGWSPAAQAHEPAAVPLAADALGHVMVDQVCRGVVPVVAAVLAQEGPLLVREVEPVAERASPVLKTWRFEPPLG